MAEPNVGGKVEVNSNAGGPSFGDLAKDMTPDVKHRYRQWRAAQWQRDLSPTNDQKVLRKRGEESRALLGMFVRPGSDDKKLFDMLDEMDVQTGPDIEWTDPFGKEHGDDYASTEAAAQRSSQQPPRPTPPPSLTAAPRSTAPAQGYNDLNSRQVGISERTFLPKPSVQDMAKKYREQTKKKQEHPNANEPRRHQEVRQEVPGQEHGRHAARERRAGRSARAR